MKGKNFIRKISLKLVYKNKNDNRKTNATKYRIFRINIISK